MMVQLGSVQLPGGITPSMKNNAVVSLQGAGKGLRALTLIYASLLCRLRAP